MDQVKAQIAHQLKSLRAKKHYTQEYIAELLGKTDYTAYQRIEHGKADLKYEDAFKLAEIYGVRMEDIMNPEEKRKDSVGDLDRDAYIRRQKNSVQLSILLDGDEITLARQIELLKGVNGLLAAKS